MSDGIKVVPLWWEIKGTGDMGVIGNRLGLSNFYKNIIYPKNNPIIKQHK